ncbi:uncharacterized protein YndB with AHSA1/START domain [Streptacidiphilus sp. MAP12-16]|uniref:SRPBCC family protein n=1 Tax=Streptacidiphilus sp. MAP12-16 TaxID=3156300 RepID=UPI003518CA26
MTDRSVTHATFVIERLYDAPPARVFAAWGDPVAKNRWFAGVEDPGAATMEVDFRVGGSERNTFTLKEGGPRYTYEAFFQDIVPDERIVLTNHMHADQNRISVNLVSIQFDAAGSGTRLTITDHGAYLDGFDRADWREEGTRDELDRLAVELGGKSS